MQSKDWKITVHELFSHSMGCCIESSFSVIVASNITIDEFFTACRSCPQNEDPSASTNAASLRPFSEALLSSGDLPVNPDARPNCRWNPSPTKTIAEAGLCDGAVLCYYTSRMKD